MLCGSDYIGEAMVIVPAFSSSTQHMFTVACLRVVVVVIAMMRTCTLMSFEVGGFSFG